MNKDDELAKYMALIEQYKEQMNTLEMQSQYIQAAITDYNKAKLTLENLINSDVGTNILLPIGGSTYINAATNNTSKVLFDIGGGIVTEKSSEDAIKIIDKRAENLQKTLEKLIETMQNLQNEATEVTNKAQQLISKEQK